MVLPNVCAMPDLSGIASRPLIHSALAAALVGDPEATQLEAMYRRNLARLTDKATIEYQRLLTAIASQAGDLRDPPETGPRLFLFAIANAAEDCIVTTNRALRLFESLKSGPLSRRIPRLHRRALEAHSKGIEPVRNALEHIDEAIRTGEIGSSGPIMAACVEPYDRLQVGPHALQFTDLAHTLAQLHKIADDLINANAT